MSGCGSVGLGPRVECDMHAPTHRGHVGGEYGLGRRRAARRGGVHGVGVGWWVLWLLCGVWWKDWKRVRSSAVARDAKGASIGRQGPIMGGRLTDSNKGGQGARSGRPTRRPNRQGDRCVDWGDRTAGPSLRNRGRGGKDASKQRGVERKKQKRKSKWKSVAPTKRRRGCLPACWALIGWLECVTEIFAILRRGAVKGGFLHHTKGGHFSPLFATEGRSIRFRDRGRGQVWGQQGGKGGRFVDSSWALDVCDAFISPCFLADEREIDRRASEGDSMTNVRSS